MRCCCMWTLFFIGMVVKYSYVAAERLKMSAVWKLVRKGGDDVFETDPVRPGVAIPMTHTIGVVIDTGSSETVRIMMNLAEITNIYWMSRNSTAAAIFLKRMSWRRARALLKRAADMREDQILSYVEEGAATAQVRAGLKRIRSKYGF